MQKIAVSSEGPSMDDLIDPRFGRAAGFILVDSQTLEYEYLDNGGSQAMGQGAGISAAERVVDAGGAVVLTGYVGPKAFKALNAAGVRVGQNMENITVRQAVEQYRNDGIVWADQPNGRRHGR